MTAKTSSGRYTPYVLAIALAGFAFHWLSERNPPLFPINDDSIRDQLLARDCAELGRCHLLGAAASFQGQHQGVIWIHLLTVVRLLGGDLAMQRAVLLAILALATAILFVFVWHWVRPSVALPAAALFLCSLTSDDPMLLLEPSAAVFPDLLTGAALFAFGVSQRWRFLIVAAFCAGVAMTTHTASLAWVPPFLAIIALARPRPWQAVSLAIAIIVLTYALPSSAALRANVLAVARRGQRGAVLGAGAFVIIAGAMLGARFRHLSSNARAWLLGLLLVLPFALTLWVLATWGRHHFTTIYLHPLLGPSAVLLAAVICVPFEALARLAPPIRWLPTVATSAFLLVVMVGVWQPRLLAQSGTSMLWNRADAQTVVRRAVARGWVYEDLALHLQGDGCVDILEEMSATSPPPQTVPVRGARQLQVIRGNASDLPRQDGDERIQLASSSVLMREIESWLRPEELTACRVPVTGNGSPSCGRVLPAAQRPLDPQRFLFISRQSLLVESIDLPRPYRATFEIPVASVVGETREVTLMDDDANGCGWRITRVEGVDVEGTIPGRRIRLHSRGGTGGVIAFAKPFGADGCPVDEIDTHYPPCILETSVAARAAGNVGS